MKSKKEQIMTIPEEMEKRLVAMFRAEWNYIADDALRLTPSGRMHRNDCFSMTADYLDRNKDKEAYEWFWANHLKLSKAAEKRLIEKIFPHRFESF